jgi:hypothetical protein
LEALELYETLEDHNCRVDSSPNRRSGEYFMWIARMVGIGFAY